MRNQDAPAPAQITSRVAGFTITAKAGRVWIHQDPAGDGGPYPAELMWELAGELHALASEADRQDLMAQAARLRPAEVVA